MCKAEWFATCGIGQNKKKEDESFWRVNVEVQIFNRSTLYVEENIYSETQVGGDLK